MDEAATQAGVQTPEDLMASDEDFNATLAAVGRIPGDTYKRPVTLAIALARTLGFHRFMMLFTSSDQQDHYQLTAAEISILRPIFEELIKIIDKHVAIASEATELTPQVAHEMFDLFRKITLLRPTR